METLLTMPISKDLMRQYFEEFEPEGEPVVKITTRQRFGQKTATGLMASFSIVKKFDGYAMEFSAPFSVPCVSIPLYNAVAPSRKVRFRMETIKAIEDWMRATQVDCNHPYYQAFSQLRAEI